MKIHINHLNSFINNRLNINDLSKLLFQLGHENEIDEGIIDIDITPNRGDCLSLNGIKRELTNFYEVKEDFQIFEKEIKELKLDFTNEAEEDCPQIMFLFIEIEDIPLEYSSYLDNYFKDLSIKKNNFFTDVSNYISYELGQPTHCYDFEKMGKRLVLERAKKESNFKALTNQEISLQKNDLVFTDGSEIINLAGIMGGSSTSCDTNSKKVLIECAFFQPEAIIGKSVKYDLKSEAAYKFERGVDPLMTEIALRRFIHIVEEHSKIKKLSISRNISSQYKAKSIEKDKSKVEDILGFKIENNKFDEILNNLGFDTKNDILIPSFRSDIDDQNHIAEEIARTVGYDNIPPEDIKIPFNPNDSMMKEEKLKVYLADNGFNEVINYPFTAEETQNSIYIDNPLDSNKAFLRTSLLNSLINSLEFNERRQKDSIKLFEISNLFGVEGSQNQSRKIGIISTGRVDHNYRDFNRYIDKNYITNILSGITDHEFYIQEISRSLVDSKNKTKIYFAEFNIEDINFKFKNESIDKYVNFEDSTFKEISDYPCIYRDLSFLVKDSSSIETLLKDLESFEEDILIERFIFDFYEDAKKNIIKIGYRFIFQSKEKTLTDLEVDKVINAIVKSSLAIDGIEIPGI